ncbi:hypothetical protein MRF4_14895 [Methylobacterium radiotolerans]|uniref:hypothetical protein n=1 Tax=Methylobacterium TaxID=407 RepID=UPI002F32C9E3
MPLDSIALIAAATFTLGCAGIHALRRHADAVTRVLTVLAYGLAAAFGWLLAGHGDLLGLSDPIPAWALVATAGI